mgnify:CR=1 FL=1
MVLVIPVPEVPIMTKPFLLHSRTRTSAAEVTAVRERHPNMSTLECFERAKRIKFLEQLNAIRHGTDEGLNELSAEMKINRLLDLMIGAYDE